MNERPPRVEIDMHKVDLQGDQNDDTREVQLEVSPTSRDNREQAQHEQVRKLAGKSRPNLVAQGNGKSEIKWRNNERKQGELNKK